MIAFLRKYDVQPRPEKVPEVRVRDPDDAWVLASALAARSEVLVTGDFDLLEIGSKLPGLRIMKPRGFWDMHRNA